MGVVERGEGSDHDDAYGQHGRPGPSRHQHPTQRPFIRQLPFINEASDAERDMDERDGEQLPPRVWPRKVHSMPKPPPLPAILTQGIVSWEMAEELFDMLVSFLFFFFPVDFFFCLVSFVALALFWCECKR
jgi:hypothetical protein